MHGLHTCVLLLLPQVATQELIRAGEKKGNGRRGWLHKIAGEGKERNPYFATVPMFLNYLLTDAGIVRGLKKWAKNTKWHVSGESHTHSPRASKLTAPEGRKKGEKQEKKEKKGAVLASPSLPFSMGALWCVKIWGFSPHPFLSLISWILKRVNLCILPYKPGKSTGNLFPLYLRQKSFRNVEKHFFHLAALATTVK